MPHDAVYGTYEPFETKNHPNRLHTFIPEGQVDKETWLYSCVIAYPYRESFDEIKTGIENTVRDYFRGEIVKWLHTAYWYEYTPYFEGEDVKNGIYKKFEALQEKNNTYYLGGSISGGTHPIVVNYAYNMINKYF